jgi:two-component system, OmpR family, sensor histidine kinase CiaH
MFSAARWRLTSIFTIVLAVILVTAGAAIYLTTRSVLFARVDDDLQERAVRDLSDFAREPHGGPPGEFVPGIKTTGGYFYAIVDPEGQALLSSANVDPDGLAPLGALNQALADRSAFVSTKSSEGESLRVYVLAAQTQGGQDVLAEIGRSTEPEHSALGQLRVVLLAAFGGSVIAAALAGFILSGRVLRPIQVAMDSQRTFIADASHELRTPVAVVRTNAELLKRHMGSQDRPKSNGDDVAVDDILSESDRLGRMVDQMLTLAQADAGEQPLVLSDVSLNEVVDEAARSMRSLAQAREVSMSTNLDGIIEVRGDAARLRELVSVLLDNAVKYTDAGGKVEVAVRKENRKAVISVSDSGEGIPTESLPHVFDRFYRVDKARSRESGGTGLGLAIARHIVEAHGGTINVRSNVGEGTVVIVELPA